MDAPSAVAAGGSRGSPFSALASEQAPSPTSQSEDNDDMDRFVSCEPADSLGVSATGTCAPKSDPRSAPTSPSFRREISQEPEGDASAPLAARRPLSGPSTPAHSHAAGRRSSPQPPAAAARRTSPATANSRSHLNRGGTGPAPSAGSGAGGTAAGPSPDVQGPATPDKDQGGGNAGGGGGGGSQGEPPPSPPSQHQKRLGSRDGDVGGLGAHVSDQPGRPDPSPRHRRPASEGGSSRTTREGVRPMPPALHPDAAPRQVAAAAVEGPVGLTAGSPPPPAAQAGDAVAPPPAHPRLPPPSPANTVVQVTAAVTQQQNGTVSSFAVIVGGASSASCISSPVVCSTTSNASTSTSFLAARVLSLDATQRSAVLRTARLCRAASASRGPAAAAAAAGGAAGVGAEAGVASGSLYGCSPAASRATSLAGVCDAAVAAAMDAAAAAAAAAAERKVEVSEEASTAACRAAGEQKPASRQQDFVTPAMDSPVVEAVIPDAPQSPFGSTSTAPPLPLARPPLPKTAMGTAAPAEATATPQVVPADLGRLSAFRSDGRGEGRGAATPSTTSAQLQDVPYLVLDRRSSLGRNADLSSYFEVLDLEVSAASAAAASAAAATAAATSGGPHPSPVAAALARHAQSLPQAHHPSRPPPLQPFVAGTAARTAAGAMTGGAADGSGGGGATSVGYTMAATTGLQGQRLPYSSSTSRLQDLAAAQQHQHLQQPPHPHLPPPPQHMSYGNRLGWTTSESGIANIASAAAVPFRPLASIAAVPDGGGGHMAWWGSSRGAPAPAAAAVHPVWSGGGAAAMRYPVDGASGRQQPTGMGALAGHMSQHQHPTQVGPQLLRQGEQSEQGHWPNRTATSARTAHSDSGRRLPQREVSFAMRPGSQMGSYGAPDGDVLAGLQPLAPPPPLGLDLTFAAPAAPAAPQHGEISTPRATAAADRPFAGDAASAGFPAAAHGHPSHGHHHPQAAPAPAPAGGSGLPLSYGSPTASLDVDYSWLDRLVAAAAAGDQATLERVVEGLEDGALAALLHTVELLELSGAGATAGATGSAPGPMTLAPHPGSETTRLPHPHLHPHHQHQQHYYHHHHHDQQQLVQDLEPTLPAAAAPRIAHRSEAPSPTSVAAAAAHTAAAAAAGMAMGAPAPLHNMHERRPHQAHQEQHRWQHHPYQQPPPPPPPPPQQLAVPQDPASQLPQRQQWRHGATAGARRPQHPHSGAEEGITATTAAAPASAATGASQAAATAAAPPADRTRGGDGNNNNSSSSGGNGSSRPAGGRGDDFHAPAHITPLMLTTARTIRPRKATGERPDSSRRTQAAADAQPDRHQHQHQQLTAAEGSGATPGSRTPSPPVGVAADPPAPPSLGASAAAAAAGGVQPANREAIAVSPAAAADMRQKEVAVGNNAGAAGLAEEGSMGAEGTRAVGVGAANQDGRGGDVTADVAPQQRRTPLASPFAQLAVQGLQPDSGGGADGAAAAAGAGAGSGVSPGGAGRGNAEVKSFGGDAGTGTTTAAKTTAERRSDLEAAAMSHEGSKGSSTLTHPSGLPPLSPASSSQPPQIYTSGRQPSRTVSGGAAERRGSGSLPYWRQQGSGGSAAGKPRQRRPPQHPAQYYHQPSPQPYDAASGSGGGGGRSPSPSFLRADAPPWQGGTVVHHAASWAAPAPQLHPSPSPYPDGVMYGSGGSGTPPPAAVRQHSWQVPYQVAHAVLHASPFTMPHLVVPWPGAPPAGYIDGPPPAGNTAPNYGGAGHPAAAAAAGEGGGVAAPQRYEQQPLSGPPQQQNPQQQQGPPGYNHAGERATQQGGDGAWPAVVPGAQPAPMARAGSLVAPMSTSPQPLMPQPVFVPVVLSQQPSGGLTYVVAPSPPPMEPERAPQPYQQQQHHQAWQAGGPYSGPWPAPQPPAAAGRHAPEDGRADVHGGYAVYGWSSGELYYTPPAPPPQPVPAPPPAGPAYYPSNDVTGFPASHYPPTCWYYPNTHDAARAGSGPKDATHGSYGSGSANNGSYAARMSSNFRIPEPNVPEPTAVPAAAMPPAFGSYNSGGFGSVGAGPTAANEQEREGRPAKRLADKGAGGEASPTPRSESGRQVEKDVGRRTRSRSRAGSPGAPYDMPKPPRDTLSTLKWCHVQHSRKQAPALDEQQVRELVRVQLQSNQPIRAPWYRDVATSRQQAQAAAASLQQRRRTQGQQQRQRVEEKQEVQTVQQQEAAPSLKGPGGVLKGEGVGDRPEIGFGTGVFIPGR